MDSGRDARPGRVPDHGRHRGRVRDDARGAGKLGVPTLEEALRCLSGRAAVDIEIARTHPTSLVTARRGARGRGDARSARRGGVRGPGDRLQLQPEVDRPQPSASSRRSDRSADLVRSRTTRSLMRRTGASVGAAVRRRCSRRATASAAGSTRRCAPGCVDRRRPEIARQLFEVGADAVATNDPRAIVPIRDEVLTRCSAEGVPDHLREPLDGLRAVVTEVEAAKDTMTATCRRRGSGTRSPRRSRSSRTT